MPNVIELPDLTPFYRDDPEWETFDTPPAALPPWSTLHRFWTMVLAVGVRDRAESVHYHSWRRDGALSYVVDWVRYELVPPPPNWARRVAAAAGSFLAGDVLSRACRRRLGWPLGTSGRIRTTSPYGPAEWAGVVWTTRGCVGVEWYRLDLPERKPHQPTSEVAVGG